MDKMSALAPDELNVNVFTDINGRSCHSKTAWVYVEAN